jgi:ketosteroid isomerase-like protein
LASEEIGWVGANVEVHMRNSGQKVPLPLRALVVYQKEREHWAIVHAHLSVGIPDELAE